MIRRIYINILLVIFQFIFTSFCFAKVTIGNASTTVYYNTNPAKEGFAYAYPYQVNGLDLFKVKLPDKLQAYTIGQADSFLPGWTAYLHNNAIVATSPDYLEYVFPESTGYKLSAIKDMGGIDIVTFEYTDGLLTKQTDAYQNNYYIEYEYGKNNDVNYLKTITLKDDLTNSVRQYSIICDMNNGNIVEITNSCGCGGGSKYKYDFNGIKLIKDANDDVVYEYVYDANGRVTDKYLGSAVNNNHMQRFVYREVNDCNYYIVDTYDYYDSTNYRVMREYKNLRGMTCKKIEYSEINADPNSLTNIASCEHTMYFFDETTKGVSKKIVINSKDFNSPDSNSIHGIRKEYTYDPNISKLLTEKWYASDDSNFIVNQYAYEYVYNYDGDIIDSKLIESKDASGGITTYYYNYWDSKPYLKIMPEVNSPIAPATVQLMYNYTYDDLQRVTEEIKQDENYNIITRTKYEYDNYGNLIKRWDDYYGHNLLTEYKYNGFNELVREKSPSGVVKGIAYNAMGKKSYDVIYDSCDANYVYMQTKYEYDYNGRLTNVFRAINEGKFLLSSGPAKWVTTRYEYDLWGHKTKVIEDFNHAGIQTIYEYNNQGQLIKTTLPNGKWTKVEYDGRGFPIRQSVGYGQTEIAVTESIYDKDGHLSEQILPDKSRTQYEYDDFGRLIRVKRGV